MEGRMGIVSGRYRSTQTTSKGQPQPLTVVELFGRSENGESVCLLVHGLRPTFEIAPIGTWDANEALPAFLEDRLAHVRAMEHVVDVTGPVVKWTQLGERPVWTIEVEQPFHVPSMRKILKARSWQIFSGDIPFVNRFFLDGDVGMHVAFSGTVIDRREETGGVTKPEVVQAGGSGRYGVDITLRCDVNDVVPTEPFQVPYTVFSFDLETSIEHETVLCAAACVEHLGTGEREVFSYRGSEQEILEGLTQTVQSTDPDIITGYNIDNFDLPRLADRTGVLQRGRGWEGTTALFGWGRAPPLESELKRQRDALTPKRQSNRAWNLSGRVIMDAWWQARQALRPRRETLSFVATLLFPDDEEKHKMDVDASNMDLEWAERPDEVMAYCIRDAELPLDILQAIQAVRRKEAVAAVAKVPFETAANGSTSQLIDSLVIRLADKQRVAVPLTGSAEAKEGQITGGYVHDVEAGLHPWIAVLDFKSMYPSIMIGHNICYTTRVDPAQPAPEEGRYHTSPIQSKFRLAEDRKGMVPALLEDLMAQRDEHKAALKTAQANEDTSAEAFHDAMQYAVKILMNSFYGVFASGFYRFTHRDLGSSITAWARQNIKGIIAAVENEGHGVVYSDTDSIFVRCPISPDAPRQISDEERTKAAAGDGAAQAMLDAYEAAVESMVAFGQGLAATYSRDSAVLEFEKGLSVFFSHGAKKRYIGQVVWPSHEMLVRGYETQRTDSFSYLTSTMKEIFRYALADQGDELVKYAKQRVEALLRCEVPASEVVLAKSCKGRVVRTPVKTPDDVDFTKDYSKPDSMAQVRVAKRRIELGLGFTTGMKVSYVVTDASKPPMTVVPWLDNEEEQAKVTYDGRFYAERLAAAVGRITEAFNWDASDLMAGNKQASLFSF
ncbi:MAG: DNA polymerase domain-containing protein [Poseidonia sp.]